MFVVRAFQVVIFSSTLAVAAQGDPLGEDVHQKRAGAEGLVQDGTSLVSACAHGTDECKSAAKKELQARVTAFSKVATDADWDPLRRLCTVLYRFQAPAADPIVAAAKACVARLAVLGGPRAGAMVRENRVQDALDFADSIASDFDISAVKHVDAAITKGRYALCSDAEKKALAACGEGEKISCAQRARSAKTACDAELKPR